LTIEQGLKKGYGVGFSAFLGLSEKNTLGIASFCTTANKIYDEETVEFNAGDCLIIKYGTLHRGESNPTETARYKIFTDVNAGKEPSSDAQLWAKEGSSGGYTSRRPRGY
jgi:hypothetical protein